MNSIFNTIYSTCQEIADYIHNGNSHQQGSHHGSKNQSADDVKNLDIWTNELFKNNLSKCAQIRYISSEEDQNILDTGNENGEYLIAFDPLDGSSNIDVNITIGTIFALFRLNNNGKIVNGRQIEMAGYCIYSQAMQMVIAERDKPVYIYFNQSDKHKIQMPLKGSIYSINESNRYRWIDKKYKKLVKQFILDGKTARWVGCLVADGHRTLMKGGFFAYPSDSKNRTGRIRLLYEAYPMAYIIESAGGYSTDGDHKSLLDVPFSYENIHQTVPIILASKEEMDQINL
jgi:fructose-1,6-bisphosphatase I